MFEISKRGNKVHFVSLGCPRNLVDTEVMLGILLKAGFEATDNEKAADYLVVNTCGFLEASREESLNAIRRLVSEKKAGAKVIVAGCMVQNHRHEIKATIPEVADFLGSGDVNKILELIEGGEIVSSARSYLEAGEVPRKLSTPKHFAYLKIAEGCRKRCAFCIIPKIKGPLQSKPKAQILKEFTALLNQGVKEIILIAQDLGDWGKDFSMKDGLTELLQAMMQEKRDFWLRLLYLYPDEITDDLIALIKKEKRILPYLDMPIQHINDSILKAMRRKTSKADIVLTIQKLRKEIPHIVIRTSLMVGFPGETEEQFQELKQFIKEYPLDNIGVFKFSKEKGAAAYQMEGQVDEETKERRYKELMQLQQKIVAKCNQQWVGKELDLILEGYHPDSNLLMIGRFYGQCPDIDATVILNDCTHAKNFGEFHRVKITGTLGYDLLGTILGPKNQKAPQPQSRLRAYSAFP